MDPLIKSQLLYQLSYTPDQGQVARLVPIGLALSLNTIMCRAFSPLSMAAGCDIVWVGLSAPQSAQKNSRQFPGGYF